MGTGVLEVKRPGREFDQPLPSSAETKNAWRYTSATPIHLHDVGREIYTFSFFF